MTAEIPLCESTDCGERCQARASWLVGAGIRITDRQYSCARHLHRTCRAMLGAELPRRRIMLSVTAVGERP